MVVLPGPGGADDGDALARRDAERHVAQHPVLAPVGEPDVVEDDLAARRRRTARGDGLGLDLLVEQPEDALGRRHRRLHHRVLRAEVADRDEEQVDVLDERQHRPDLQRVRLPEARALPQHGRDRDRAHRVDDREQRRLELVGELVGVAVGGVEPVELGVASAPRAPTGRSRPCPRSIPGGIR